MKKKVGIIILVIIVLIIIVAFIHIRLYYFTVIKNVYDTIEKFRNEENRYYSVAIKDSNIVKEEVITKNNIIKWSEKKNGIDVYCEWKDFNSEKEYFILFKNKTFNESDLIIVKRQLLRNLPNVVLDIFQDDNFNLKEFLRIKYILSIDYNNQKCYKIVTSTETLIVNKETYLPIYYSLDLINSDKTTKTTTETTYEFKVGEVTDEDVALPDLTGYTKINKE